MMLNKINYAKIVLKLKKRIISVVFSCLLFVGFIGTKVVQAEQSLTEPPKLKDLETLFIKALTVVWVAFVLDSIVFLVRNGAKYLFTWAGVKEPEAGVLKDASSKLGRFAISIIGVFAMPLIIGILMSILFQKNPADDSCYEFLRDGNGVFQPVFQIYFDNLCK